MNFLEKAELNKKQINYLGGNLQNKRVGDFLYRHKEANPSIYCFWNDIKGCVVVYSSENTDVVVDLPQEKRDILKPRLINYLKELVARHNEILHEELSKRFHGVTITLPSLDSFEGDKEEYIIHTGSGCCYDQDEIAYEIMVALSGIPVYKALSPIFSCHTFVRQDALDDGGWIRYLFEEKGIQVTYSHSNDLTRVVVSKFINSPRSDWELFEKTMYASFSEWLKVFSRDSFVANRGFRSYGYERDSLSGRQNSIEISIEPWPSSLKFTFQVPYFAHINFARIAFARDIMKTLSETFPVTY